MGFLQIDGVQRVPEPVVSQVFTKEKEVKKKESKGGVAGWSTEKMEQKAHNQLERDTEEMVSWRSINREEIDDIWMSWQELKKCL